MVAILVLAAIEESGYTDTDNAYCGRASSTSKKGPGDGTAGDTTGTCEKINDAHRKRNNLLQDIGGTKNRCEQTENTTSALKLA